MKNSSAFTLIELLVVVLIIGILAAVALPQYQKAVWKARFAKDIATIESLKPAADAFLLANEDMGPYEYSQITDKLDVSPSNSVVSVWWDTGGCENGEFGLQILLAHSDDVALETWKCGNNYDEIRCYSPSGPDFPVACEIFNAMYK